MSLTRRLSKVEARVAGALMEKEQTTPDAYPLTVNALIAACNQKSNRQPVTTYGEEAVRDALDSLRKDVLAWRVDGARVERWEHRLTGRWQLDKPAKAIMTLLLLRGPQTPGELRSRSTRMHPFADVTETEAKLREMASGDDPLVRELPREPGQRENRWRHLMLRREADDSEATAPGAEQPARPPRAPPSAAATAPSTAAANRAPVGEDRLETLTRRVAELERRIARLEGR